MTDDRSKALVPQAPASLSPLSRLAERTLVDRAELEEQALVAARTLVVGPGGYATITKAVDAARDGDTILVRPGRYEESVVVDGKTITIRGDGERDAIVVGWDEGPAFVLVETRSTLAGLTLTGESPESESEAEIGRYTNRAAGSIRRSLAVARRHRRV
jgi:pectin methylesterase-like acyl-CoA thioesterase